MQVIRLLLAIMCAVFFVYGIWLIGSWVKDQPWYDHYLPLMQGVFMIAASHYLIREIRRELSHRADQ